MIKPIAFWGLGQFIGEDSEKILLKLQSKMINEKNDFMSISGS